MDELFASGIKLAYPQEYSSIVEYGDETETFKVQRIRVNCPKSGCFHWAKHNKNISTFLDDLIVERHLAFGYILGENYEPFLCRMKEGVVYNDGLRIVMLKGDH